MHVKKNVCCLLFLFCAICFSSKLQAQNYRFYQNWTLNLNIGGNAFYGDLTDNKNKFWHNSPLSKYFYEDRKTMYGFCFGKAINKSVAIKSQFLWGSLYSHQESTGLQFSADIFEANMHVSANLLTMLSQKENKIFDIYAFLGFGFCSFRTLSTRTADQTYISSYGYTEKGQHLAATIKEWIIPMGLGMSYKLNKHWKVNVETSLRFLLSDRLDANIISGGGFEGYSYNTLGFTYNFNMFEYNIFRRRGSSGFTALKDNSSRTYNRGTSNGNVKRDPFKKHRKNKNYVYQKKTRKKFLGIF